MVPGSPVDHTWVTTYDSRENFFPDLKAVIAHKRCKWPPDLQNRLLTPYPTETPITREPDLTLCVANCSLLHRNNNSPHTAPLIPAAKTV